MTEKEFKTIASAGVLSRITQSIKLGQAISTSQVLDLEIQNINAWWKSVYKKKQSAFITLDGIMEQRTLPDLIHTLMPMLEENASQMLLSKKKKATITKIQFAASKAQIEELLRKENLKFVIFEQVYRAKIYIALDKGKKLVLPIKYKTIQEDIEKILPAIQAARKMLEDFGKDVKLY